MKTHPIIIVDYIGGLRVRIMLEYRLYGNPPLVFQDLVITPDAHAQVRDLDMDRLMSDVEAYLMALEKNVAFMALLRLVHERGVIPLPPGVAIDLTREPQPDPDQEAE